MATGSFIRPTYGVAMRDRLRNQLGQVVTASYEVPPYGTLFHIRRGPLHLRTYSNCCQVCSVQVEHSIFIRVERNQQNGIHFIYDLTIFIIFLLYSLILALRTGVESFKIT